MTTPADRRHLDLNRSRFTRNAQEFARFALATRGDEAQRLVEMAAPRGDDLALDLACGPGTFTRAFAPRVREMYCLDLTPAMLDQARAELARAGVANAVFACGDANALPFADSVLGLALCGYAFHHFLEPGRVLGELGRVLRPGGRLVLADVVVPEGADPGWNNRIERARDPSHARTLGEADFAALLQAAGLRVRARQLSERLRRFDDWLHTVNGSPGTAVYEETRRLMEASLEGDSAGFHPQRSPASPDATRDELEFVQTTLLLVAEKL